MKVAHPKTVNEAIDNLQTFLEADMWHCIEEEWKTEEDMIEYLNAHFDILRNEIKRIKK